VRGRAVLAALVAAAVAAPAAVAAAPLSTPEKLDRAVQRGELTRRAADVLLADALTGAREDVPLAYRGSAPWDGTSELLRLQRSGRGVAPTAPQPGALGCGGTVLVAPASADGQRVHVEYEPASLDPSLSAADYVTALDAAFAQEVDVFGWPAPPVRPASGRYPVLLSDDLPDGVFGFVTNEGDPTLAGPVGDNPATPWPDGDASATCMVLNADFQQFRGDALDSMRATVAHEFLHALQFGIGALDGRTAPDLAMVESTAVYMEDEVFDDANDAYFYPYPDFTDDLGQHADTGVEPYAAWLLVRGMLERYGSGTPGGGQAVLRSVFEQLSRDQRGFLAALEAATAARGAGDLGASYHEAAVGLRFLEECGPALSAPFCLEEALPFLSIPGRNGDRPAPHAALPAVGAVQDALEENYAAHFLKLDGLGLSTITVQTRGGVPGALRATAACRTASGQRRVSAGQIPAGDARAFPFPIEDCNDATLILTSSTRTGDDPADTGLIGYRVATASAGPLTHPLTVQFTGPGAATARVRSDVGGLECTSDCTLQIPAGALVDLSAVGDTPLLGWSGACGGITRCQVAMTGPRVVTAAFAGAAAADDTLAPVLALPRRARLWGRVTAVRLTCPARERNGCEGVLSLTAKVGGRRRTLARAAFPTRPAGRSFTVRLVVPGALARTLRRSRSVAAVLRLEVNDRSGNARVQRRSIRLRTR
jgi:hypothetical protein